MKCTDTKSKTTFGITFADAGAEEVFNKLKPGLQVFTKTELDKIAEKFNRDYTAGHDVRLRQSISEDYLHLELIKDNKKRGMLDLCEL